MIKLFHDGGSYHIETSPFISSASQWTGFYMIGTSAMKKLRHIVECVRANKISLNSKLTTKQNLFFLDLKTKSSTQTLAQEISCEFCEISKNTFFTEHLWATTSDS